MTENLQDLRGTGKCQSSFNEIEIDSLQCHQQMEKLREEENEHFQLQRVNKITEETLKDGRETASVILKLFFTESLP